MKQPAQRGMTLAELLIGFFLLCSASIIFFQAMHGFRKETTFTSENFLASSLIEKVLEQCYQESELNPHGLQAIGLTDNTGKPYPFTTFITDKETVFFSNPEITETATPNLHRVLKDNFSLVVDGEQKSGFYEINASFNWKAQSGKGEALSSTRILSFTGEKEVLTTFTLTEEQVKQRLVKDVFNAPGASLGSRVSSAGAEKLLISIGHIYYAGKDWLNSSDFKDRYQKAKDLETSISPDSDDFAKCTGIYFEMARDLLHLMISLKKHAEDAKAGIGFLASVPLPERFIVHSRIERGGLYYRQLRRIFFNCLLKVSERYEQMLKTADTPRLQRQMIVRLFNINRILFENRAFIEEVAPTETAAHYKKFVTTIQESFRETDPSIFRLADQEQGFINNNNLKEQFFVLKLSGELCTTIDEYLAILDPA